MNKLNEKIPFEKRVSYLNQTDVLKEAKEKGDQNKEIKNTRSKVLQTAKLVTRINVLKGIRKTKKRSRLMNMKRGKTRSRSR